ncbi:MAG: NAD(P)/FAD-dependent oxidoreductase [Jiangellales bacterium]
MAAVSGSHVDVLIIGAGLSGIGAACHLARRRPGTSYAILEARPTLGGTWDLFRYPGIRSDSDMFTMGYAFEPWTDAAAVADGPSILDYLTRTARRHGVDRAIRYQHRVVQAEWSSPQARWTVVVDRTDTGERTEMTCSFLWVCAGYYRYEQGYTPDWPGRQSFCGDVVHPQHWPADLDVSERRVVVVGSGATAVTLVPALSRTAAHVTMLQRTPSYVMPVPSDDALARTMLAALPPNAAHSVMRWKNVVVGQGTYTLSRRRPELARRLIRRTQQAYLPDDFDADTHLTPPYDPWDQRLCMVPDADLFRAVSSGRASIVTDTIERFEPTGVRLLSGHVLEADVVVTATGFTLNALGGVELLVDGVPIAMGDTVAYLGAMLSDVPNMAFVVGYTNAAWTLKADLVSIFVCRLLAHMDKKGYRVVTPQPPPPHETVRRPIIDVSSGYVTRSVSELPKQGSKAPWRLHQNYPLDVALFRYRPISARGLRFSQ